MAKLEIHPFSEDFREPAAALLADRHARHRAVEPLLPEIGDFAAQIPEGEGAIATRGGEVVAYVIATVGEERAEIGPAGCAASEPEAVRDVYAHLAPGWPIWHQAMIPASDAALVDAWFRLACGLQFTTAMRDVSPLDVREFPGTIRPSTPADLQTTAGFDRLLWSHLSRSPSFSGLDVDAKDFESEWGTLWDETDEFPYHRVAELDGRVVGHILLYKRPTGDLRVPEQNIDLAHAATLEDARGTGAMLALTAGAIDWAREQGYRSFTTDWRVVNLEASRYWPRQGFRPTFYRLARAVPKAQ
jgi:GNAT superfamily N-acetyltransferase